MDEQIEALRVIALEPYYGGSHLAFLDGLQAHSQHDWTILGLPAHKWKWRMRHSAIHFAQKCTQLMNKGENWDVLVCSEMLNLAEFKGLVGPVIASLPTVIYFHENQFDYPARHHDERDLHLAMINFTSALAADEVWFNSEYHRANLLNSCREMLQKMPDYQPMKQLDQIARKSIVQHPSVEALPARPARVDGPPVLAWVARWEHDKNPELFFEALYQLIEEGLNFRLAVLGEQFRETPEIFATARTRLGDRVIQWGYLENRKDYINRLLASDIVVSTADHEFFGLAVVEAMVAGCYPLLPKRLVYPELLEPVRNPDCFLYDGTLAGLTEQLRQLIQKVVEGQDIYQSAADARVAASRFLWSEQVLAVDERLSAIVNR